MAGEDVHESAARLYAAAKTIAAVEGKSAIARLLNESPQNVNNWEARGVSEGGALKAQALLGCSATWVLTGVGPRVPNWPFSDDLLYAVSKLKGGEITRLEAVMRAHLGLPEAQETGETPNAEDLARFAASHVRGMKKVPVKRSA